MVMGTCSWLQIQNTFQQIQGQMGIYCCKSADLVIYTQQGIHAVEDIVFDEPFFRDMNEKPECYYKHPLLKKNDSEL